MPTSRANWPNSVQVTALPDAEMLLAQARPARRARSTLRQNIFGMVSAALGRRHRQSFLRFHRRVPLTPPAFMPR